MSNQLLRRIINIMPESASLAMDDITRALRLGTTLILPSSSNAALSAMEPVSASPVAPIVSVASDGPPRVAEYEIIELLGAGGMGMVFKARHVWLDKIVAIKLLAEGTFRQPQAVTRFLREAQMTAGLDHPHIVRATDAGEVNGVHYMVTELVVGKDLARIVERGGKLSVADACAIICQAAGALQYAHEKGLVHRDIKPSNLMLTVDDEQRGIVKVLDFGLARLHAQQDTLTASGHVLGTLDFMPPEQASDPRGVDARADIYSLGCTLYFLLTGAPPFSGAQFDSVGSKLNAHLQTPPPDLRRVRRDVPTAVRDVLQGMLAKTPAQRPCWQKIIRKLSRHAGEANLARLLEPTLTDNQHGMRRSWSIASSLLAALLLPWTLLCWLAGCVFASQPTAERRKPMFSVSGLLMLSGLAAFFVAGGFSCVPMEHSARWQNCRRDRELPQPVTWESSEMSFSWE